MEGIRRTLVLGLVLIAGTAIEQAPSVGCCCLPTPLTLVCGGESDHPAFSPQASLSLHLASSSITSAGSVYKSRGDNVGAVKEMMCVVCVDVTEGT